MADSQARLLGPSRFALELGAVKAGYVSSVEGGSASGDVVEEKVGVDGIVHKHIAGVKYEDITVTCGTGMSKAFYEWLKATFDRKHTRVDGAIKKTDYDGNLMSEMDFFHAIVSEIGFPELDASSKDAAKLTIKISPEYTRSKKGSGKDLPATGASPKKWLPSNFRLAIQGLDCTHVNKIDALTIAQQVVSPAVGEKRDYEKELGGLQIPRSPRPRVSSTGISRSSSMATTARARKRTARWSSSPQT